MFDLKLQKHRKAVSKLCEEADVDVDSMHLINATVDALPKHEQVEALKSTYATLRTKALSSKQPEANGMATAVAATDDLKLQNYRKAISKLCDEAGLSACLQPLFDTVDAKPKEQQVEEHMTVYDKLRQSKSRQP